MSNRSKRTWPLSLGISLAVHLVLVGLIVFFVIDHDGGMFSSSPSGSGSPGSEAAGGSSASAGDRDDDGPTEQDVREMWSFQHPQSEQMTPAEREEALEGKLGDLEAIAPTAVDSAAGLVERVKGVDRQRAWAPRANVGGSFDAESAVLYDIRRDTRNGQTVYIHTLVDAAGRSQQAPLPADQMSGEDLRAYRMFEMARGNPNLRRLLDASIRIGQAMGEPNR